jgi:hypothetical protein
MLWRAATLSLALLLVTPATTLAFHRFMPPYADVISGPMWGGVDPRGDADQAVSRLSSGGYHAFDDNNVATPTQALGDYWAADDAIWVAMGHANGGLIIVENGATGGPPSSHISAIYASSYVDRTPDADNSKAANLYDKPYHYLHNIRLMVFFGCDSGLDGKHGTPWDGNLVKEAVGDQGVGSAIGFTYYIRYLMNADLIWTEAFYDGLTVYHLTLSESASLAATMVSDLVGGFYNTYGFENPYIVNGGVKIYPALDNI